MIRWATLLALPVVLVAAVVAALVHEDPAPGPAQARLEVDGRAVVTGPDGVDRVVTGEAVAAFGDRVVVADGTAVLTLGSGARYELRRRGGVGSEVVVDRRPVLVAGDALVGGAPRASVRVGPATVVARGPVKVDAEGEVASVYAGVASVDGMGEGSDVHGLRRLALTPGARVEPVVFDGTDPWDRRFLGEAIAFGEQLEALARGYTRDLPPGAGRTEGFFRTVLPALAAERDFGADLLDPARPPGETLVGASIAVQGRRGSFRERWEQVFSFRAAGAAWGLVALDQRVSSAPVLETIEVAIAAPRRAPARSDRAPTPTPAPARTPAPTTTRPVPVPPPTSTTVPPVAPPPSVPPEPEPEPGLLSPVLDPVSELVEGLLGALLGGG